MGRLPKSRIGVTLMAAAAALAAVGGGAVGLGAPAGLAGAVAGFSALVASTVVDRVFHARDERDTALRRRSEVLDKLKPDPWDGDRELELLQASHSLTPAWGRRHELKRLEGWLADDQACPALLISGPAGVGKSRLALEFASRLPTEWATGWLRAEKGGEAVDAVRACKSPAVILVDDADGRTDLVPLLDVLAEESGGSAIRAVIITRSTIGLRRVLATQLDGRHKSIATKAKGIDLQPVGGYEDHDRWFKKAVSKFAEALEAAVPNIPDRPHPSQEVSDEPFLILQAKALLAVLGTSDKEDKRNLSFEQIANELMEHEEARWYRLAKTSDWGSGGPPSKILREHSVAALALLGSSVEGEAVQILHRIPELHDANAERLSDITAWISTLYPEGPSGAPRIQPDMFGEWFVVHQLTKHPALAQSLRREMTDPQASRALAFLARAADRAESAGPLFEEFGAGDIRRRALAAAQAALTGETGRQLLDPVVARQIRSADGWKVDQLAELEQQIPQHVLLLTHAAIAELTVTMFRGLSADGTADQAALAGALTSLNEKLEQVGRSWDALAPGEEAVAMYRDLAAANPAVHRSGLVRALINLGITLEKLGRYRDALATGEEAVAISRSLSADGAADQAAFAEALANLSERLVWVGRSGDALAAGEEAVAMYRDLAAANPAVHRSGLAWALINLGTTLEKLGRFRDGLAAGEEAVATYRDLAAGDLAAHRSGLAWALANLSERLVWVGRSGDALAAGEEAVAMYRDLAAANPAVHRSGLAWALGDLGWCWEQVGRLPDALAAGREALAIYRDLAADNPFGFQAELAEAWKAFGAWNAWKGHYQDALPATEEAVRMFRDLAADYPDAYLRDVAWTLVNLNWSLRMVGRNQDALDAGREAVTLYRALATDNPAAHQEQLAWALWELSFTLNKVGDLNDALASKAECVDIYKELASRDSNVYQEKYRQHLGQLQEEYTQRGMHEEAIRLGIDSPSDRPPLPPHD